MITKVRALMSAVESGSLKAAAENLGCTQSAVSHMISSLEEELGFRLLNSCGRLPPRSGGSIRARSASAPSPRSPCTGFLPS